MKRVILITFIAVFVLTMSTMAQLSDKAEVQSIKQDYTGLNPAGTPFSLIDLSRIKWSHSYSVSFFSGGNSSGSMGLYTGSMFYELSSSLSLDIRVGIAHNPGALFNNGINTDAKLFPAINLDYHPSDNFRFSIGFASYPGVYYNPYYQNRSNLGRPLR